MTGPIKQPSSVHRRDGRRPGLLAAVVPGLLCAALVGCGSNTSSHSDVLHVQLDQVVASDGKPVWLRGLQFTNWAFSDTPQPDAPTTYADESDYQRAAAMGVNAVAFVFRAEQFEDEAAPGQYRQSGFDWFDQNIAWAKAAGIYLIPTLLAPPGSPQWEPNCDRNTVWDKSDYQDRTVALWRSIAQHYAEEPVIAGYNLLADVLPTTSVEQWHLLAGRALSAIREVDRKHILVVEPAQGAACTFKGVLDGSDLFLVNDPNVLYALTAMFPWEYVSQLMPSQGLGDGGSYPDEAALGALNWNDICSDPNCELEWEHNSWDSTPQEPQIILKPEETTWTQESFAYRVFNPDYQIGEPALQSDNNLGKVYFDDFTVKEYDENLNFVRTVMNVDLEDASPWYLFQDGPNDANCTDCGATVTLESDAHHGHHSISVSGTTTATNLSNGALAFPAKLNHSYEMSGWIKGLRSAPKGASRFTLEFYKYKKNGGVLPLRDKANLAQYLQSFVAWGKTQRVPLFVSNFGTGRPTFLGDKGGLAWTRDMLDLSTASHLHFVYNEYHGDDFGLYAGDGLPDLTTANQPLIDLLTAELSQ